MRSFLKYSILALLVLGLGYGLWVVGSSLYNPQANQAQLAAKGKAAKPVLGQLITLRPRPVQPKAAFLDREGQQVHLSDFAGKVVLLNIWATWCEPCVKEMPSLNALQAQLGGADFEVVAISADRSKQEAKDFYAQNGLDQLSFYQDKTFEVVRALYVKDYPSGLPISVLYDREGRELTRLSGGFDWVSEPALARINQAILQDGAVATE